MDRMEAVVTLAFTVRGIPKPQGSKRAFVRGGRAQLVESAGQPLKDWRADVKAAAEAALGERGPLAGPLVLKVTFFLPRPKSAKPGALPDKRPDLDKLLRSTLDALTAAAALNDDAQIVEINSAKVYTSEPHYPPGASIALKPWEPPF